MGHQYSHGFAKVKRQLSDVTGRLKRNQINVVHSDLKGLPHYFHMRLALAFIDSRHDIVLPCIK